MKNKAAQQLGRLGGKVTSEAKTAAVRENGAKGGRPRKDETLACTYVRGNGQECHELVRSVAGKYLITVNGRVLDARNTLPLSDAQEWYDNAGYQLASRPSAVSRSPG